MKLRLEWLAPERAAVAPAVAPTAIWTPVRGAEGRTERFPADQRS
jgi:hypothetical protein